jgi:hypothetical protein
MGWVDADGDPVSPGELYFTPMAYYEYDELLEELSLDRWNKPYEDLNLDEKIVVIDAACEAVD